MKLRDYIALTGKTLEQVATELDSGATAGTVSRWQSGKIIPRRDEMNRIKTWSKGAVMPNDFYPDERGVNE